MLVLMKQDAMPAEIVNVKQKERRPHEAPRT